MSSTATVKKTRVEFLYDVFRRDCERAAKYKTLTYDQNSASKEDVFETHFDAGFNEVYRHLYLDNGQQLKGETSLERTFNYFLECDPTQNKEYVNWFLNLYRTTLKNIGKFNTAPPEFPVAKPQSTEIFFEDLLTKVKEALEVFTFLKKTNVLSVESRDINRFKYAHEFVDMVKPYMVSDEGDDSVHTLDHKELACIRNFVDTKDCEGQAELVFENNDWVVVITHDKEANKEFGKYTTWCTAGTRWGNMFSSYHGRGELFVLVKKGYGSKRSIKDKPSARLQFHFEDGQYMDANDKGININEFLHKNKELKNFFRTYIISDVLPKKMHDGKQTDIIKYLLNLGYGDEIIKILKDSKPSVVDFSKHKIDEEYLKDIGEIDSAVELLLDDCGMGALPESIRRMSKLRKLVFKNNPLITVFPEWIKELKNLEEVDCAGCNIKSLPDLSENKNLVELVLDYNRNLTNLPPNIGSLTKLERLTASYCDITHVDDDILNCVSLHLLDVHCNKQLNNIPLELAKLPKMEAICFDGTKISMDVKKAMERDNNGHVSVLKYPDRPGSN